MKPRAALLATAIVMSGICLGDSGPAPNVSQAFAQGPAPAPALTVKEVVRGKIYWVEGGGGTAGFVVGDKGVILIDAKRSPEAGKALAAAVAKVTPKPITHVILTHADGDHVNGLAGLPDGLTIIAHENAKIEQQGMYLYAVAEIDGGRCLPPLDRMPNLIMRKSRVETTIDGERLVLHHFPNAHTTGDIAVELPAYKTAFAGDVITDIVLLHPERGGTLDGWFSAARGLLALDVDTFIAGHSATLETKASIRKRIADLQAQRDVVAGMVDHGQTLAQVKLAMKDPEKLDIGCRGIPRPTFAENAFHDRVNRNQELK